MGAPILELSLKTTKYWVSWSNKLFILEWTHNITFAKSNLEAWFRLDNPEIKIHVSLNMNKFCNIYSTYISYYKPKTVNKIYVINENICDCRNLSMRLIYVLNDRFLPQVIGKNKKANRWKSVRAAAHLKNVNRSRTGEYVFVFFTTKSNRTKYFRLFLKKADHIALLAV